MHPILPLAFIIFLIGLGISVKPFVDKSIERSLRRRKQMREDYLNLRTLIDEETGRAELMELWHEIHKFYRTYKFCNGAKECTSRLHARRLNHFNELFPTRYSRQIEALYELEELHLDPCQAN